MITALHPPEGKRGGSSCKMIKKRCLTGGKHILFTGSILFT